MQKPSATALPVTLYAYADDAGEGPTTLAADYFATPGATYGAEYEVPAGFALHVQQVGVSLRHVVSGESAWADAYPIAFTGSEAAPVPLMEEVLGNLPSRPGPLSEGHWCWFDAFTELPEETYFFVGMVTTTPTRTRGDFVVRGWLVPSTG